MKRWLTTSLLLLLFAAPLRAEVNPAFIWPTLFQLSPGYREDTPHVSGQLGTFVMAVRKDSATALASTDGDYSPFIVDGSGRLWASVVQSGAWTVAATQSGTWTVTANAGSGTFAVAGAGTFGTGMPSTGQAGGFDVAGFFRPYKGVDADTGAGTDFLPTFNLVKRASGGAVEAGTASDPLRTDPTGTTIQPVSGTVTANAGSGTFRIDEAAASGGVVSRQNLDLDSGGGAQNREAIGIALAASGGSVALEGTTANGAEVDVTRVQGTVTVSDGAGALNVIVDSSALPTGASTLGEQQTQTTALQKIDNIAHSGSDVALSEHVPISGQLDDASTTTVTENQVAPIRITSARALHVSQQGTVTVSGTVTANAGSGTFTVGDGSGPLTVDGTVTSNQGGAPWSVAGPAADGAAVSGNPVRVAGKDGSGNTQDIITDSSGELQVDVLTLPNVAQSTASNLKAEVWGAAKGSTTAAGITVHAIDANTNGFAVIPAGALVAGNNNIGDVDVASFPDNEPVAQGTAAASTSPWPTSGGTVAAATAAWTSGTASDTAISVSTVGMGTAFISYRPSGSPAFTAGMLRFEASDDAGSNYYAITCARLDRPFRETAFPLNGETATNYIWQCGVGSSTNLRVRLNPAITGAGTANLRLQASAISPETSVITQPGEEPTYIAFRSVAAAAALDALSIFNASGSGRVVRVMAVYASWQETAAVAPVKTNFTISRSNTVGTTCTAVTVVKADTANPAVPSQITSNGTCTTDPVVDADLLACSMYPEEGSAAGPASDVTTCYEWVPGRAQPITLREGFGLMVKSVATLAPTGTWGLTIIFTIAPS